MWSVFCLLRYLQIEESNSAWSSPILLVLKQDGSVRFRVDYRKVNDVSCFNAYPMPRVDNLLYRLGTARFFTMPDLTKGYWQIVSRVLGKEPSPLRMGCINLSPFQAVWGPCYVPTPHGPGAASPLSICCSLL